MISTNYVITNYRFDETFKQSIHKALSAQEPLELTCEAAVTLTPLNATIQFTPHQISNHNHEFTCTGATDSNIGRLEEINGTLYLTVF